MTSSSATAGGALTGLGVPPTRIDGVIGIAKAYTTRVGAGPLPSEIGGALEDQIREKGNEFGASTGRPRRCGWFDAVVVRYSVRVNGLDSLALTKLDVLDELAEIQVCTGVPVRGRADHRVPGRPLGARSLRAGLRDAPRLAGCRPRACATSPRSPRPRGGYVDRLSELVGTEIGIVSTGPDRDDTILRSESAVTSWFE